jgi:ligand-binding sensor domain-containing protein
MNLFTHTLQKLIPVFLLVVFISLMNMPGLSASMVNRIGYYIRFKIFKKDNENRLSIGSNKIFTLLKVSEGDIWVGTANGIYMYDPQHEIFNRFEIRYTERTLFSFSGKGKQW